MPTWPLWRIHTGRADRSERLRRYWDKHARSYDRQMAFFERVLFGDGRQWICSQAAGDVLEVAIGTGRNLPLYPGQSACVAARSERQAGHVRLLERGRWDDAGGADEEAVEGAEVAAIRYHLGAVCW
jgi:hypothetical protein